MFKEYFDEGVKLGLVLTDGSRRAGYVAGFDDEHLCLRRPDDSVAVVRWVDIERTIRFD